jgi:hypothetical protein
MCLNPIIFLDKREHTLADLNSLIINETRETLESTAVDWSAKAVNFIEATFLLDELLDLSFFNL